MTTILAYGDSNTWGAMPMRAGETARRYPPEQRWPMVMTGLLGPGVSVIAEGLNGRTTCLDDPVEGRHKNGEAHLLVALESHMPLDLVIIMLGTNDLKVRYGMPSADIAAGAGRLVKLVQTSECGPARRPPRVLLACPASVARLSRFAEMFEGAEEKSRRLAPAFRAVAETLGVPLVDLGTLVTSSDIDGIHFDADQQVKLGEAMAEVVKPMVAGEER
jgi:lysophospholipase L1-like esterase